MSGAGNNLNYLRKYLIQDKVFKSKIFGLLQVQYSFLSHTTKSINDCR